MHVIPPASLSISLLSPSGIAAVYPSIAHARAALGASWMHANIGGAFRVWHSTYWDGAQYSPWYLHYPYILQDAGGRTLNPDEWAVPWAKRGRLGPRDEDHSLYRGHGPVAGIGRRGRYRMYRRPATTSERRAAAVVDVDEPAPRKARSANRLPTSWDDVHRNDMMDRNWKRQRNTQWKVRG